MNDPQREPPPETTPPPLPVLRLVDEALGDLPEDGSNEPTARLPAPVESANADAPLPVLDPASLPGIDALEDDGSEDTADGIEPAVMAATSSPPLPSAPPAPPPSSASSARAFGARPGSAPVPPPGPERSLIVKPHAPPLRREVSVLEEAARLRGGPLFRLRALTRTGTERLLHLATGLGSAATDTLGRFEQLPRPAQVAWVAVPYLLAAVLGALVLLSRSATEETAHAVAPQAGTLVSLPPAAEPAPVVVAAPRPPATPEAQELAQPEAWSGEPRILPVWSALYVRPEPGRRAARLRAGHALTVFPRFPAPEGWVLAESEKGTVGFVSTRHLAGEPDPVIDQPKRRRRR